MSDDNATLTKEVKDLEGKNEELARLKDQLE